MFRSLRRWNYEPSDNDVQPDDRAGEAAEMSQ
jgi:hypothetical protein